MINIYNLDEYNVEEYDYDNRAKEYINMYQNWTSFINRGVLFAFGVYVICLVLATQNDGGSISTMLMIFGLVTASVVAASLNIYGYIQKQSVIKDVEYRRDKVFHDFYYYKYVASSCRKTKNTCLFTMAKFLIENNMYDETVIILQEIFRYYYKMDAKNQVLYIQYKIYLGENTCNKEFILEGKNLVSEFKDSQKNASEILKEFGLVKYI